MKSLSYREAQDILGGDSGDAAYVAGFVIGVLALPVVPLIAFYDIYQNHL